MALRANKNGIITFKECMITLKRSWLLMFLVSLAACNEPNVVAEPTSTANPVVTVSPVPASTATVEPTLAPTQTPLPTATLEPTPTELPVECTNPNAEPDPVAVSISDKFEPSYDDVMAWYCAGESFEDILLALTTSELTGLTVEELFEMKDEVGWDQVWMDLGLVPTPEQ
jgi:hypothetical protein